MIVPGDWWLSRKLLLNGINLHSQFLLILSLCSHWCDHSPRTSQKSFLALLSQTFISQVSVLNSHCFSSLQWSSQWLHSITYFPDNNVLSSFYNCGSGIYHIFNLYKFSWVIKYFYAHVYIVFRTKSPYIPFPTTPAITLHHFLSQLHMLSVYFKRIEYS